MTISMQTSRFFGLKKTEQPVPPGTRLDWGPTDENGISAYYLSVEDSNTVSVNDGTLRRSPLLEDVEFTGAAINNEAASCLGYLSTGLGVLKREVLVWTPDQEVATA
jgi:hypothetical protein